MKKLFTLLLVLLLCVGLTVPAMAFTSDTSEEEDHPYDLSIYLVDYEDNDLFGLVALPASDRGYAKNEIVAAVVQLVVPEDEEITTDEYGTMVFGGENVDLDVTDNYDGNHISLESKLATGSMIAVESKLRDDEIVFHITKLPGDNTYKWLFFAKVTDDDASLYAKLIDGIGSHGFCKNQLIVELSGDIYGVHKYYNSDKGGWYLITYHDGGHLVGIYLFVDEDYVTEGMAINLDMQQGDDEQDAVALGVNTANKLGIVEGAIIDTGDDAEDYLDVYQDVVVDVFGMDYFKIGNYLRDSFFEDMVSGDTIIATVDIKPWTAYVTVPTEVVVDPPKTGDAASLMGFVMVALSAAGTLALKRRF